MHFEVLKVNMCKPECNYNKKGKPGYYGIESFQLPGNPMFTI